MFEKEMVIEHLSIVSRKYLVFCWSSTTDERNKDLPIELSPSPSIPGMDDAEFRRRGKEMIDYIADYLKHIR